MPDYLEGELLKTVQAFSSEVDYDVIKSRLLKDFIKVEGVTGSNFSDLLNAKRRTGESLNCFHIRLEGLASKLGLDQDSTNLLILSVLEKNIEPTILSEINKLKYMGTEITVEVFLKLSTELASINRPSQLLTCSENESVFKIADNNNLGSGASGSRCFGCGEVGHYRRDCKSSSIDQTNIVCFTCRQKGHVSKMCPNKEYPSESRENNSVVCVFCGKSGHYMKYCHEFQNLNRYSQPNNENYGHYYSRGRGFRGAGRGHRGATRGNYGNPEFGKFDLN